MSNPATGNDPPYNIEVAPVVLPQLRDSSEHKCPICSQPVQVNLSFKCPSCANQLVIRKNRTNGNEFVGCSKFPTCKWTMNIKKFLIYSSGGPVSSVDGEELRKIDI